MDVGPFFSTAQFFLVLLFNARIFLRSAFTISNNNGLYLFQVIDSTHCLIVTVASPLVRDVS